MSPVPIYTPGWRETKWSKVPCLKKKRDGRGLDPGPPDPEMEVLTTRPQTPPPVMIMLRVKEALHFILEKAWHILDKMKRNARPPYPPPTPAPVKYEAARRRKGTILPSLIWGKGRVCGNPAYILSEIVVSQFFLFLFLFEQVLLFYFFT